MRPPLTYFLSFFAACTAACFLTACGKPPGGPPPAQGKPTVGVITVHPRHLALTTQLPGRTSAYLVAQVRPQVAGIIKTRLFKEGSDVTAGQALYQIDPATYKATHDSNLAALAKAQATLKTARLKAERYKQLLAIQAVSQQDYDDASASLGEDEAQVASAKADVESSRINLSYARVDSPISGRIGKSSVTPGTLVTASQTTELATVQQLDPLYVDLSQSSTALLQLKHAMARGELQKSGANSAKVQLLLEDGSAYPHEGTLEFSDVTVDQNTGTITLRAVFPNPDGDLLPGMYVRAILQEAVKENALLVPQQAVSRDGAGKPFAYVVDSEKKLQRRPLQTERAVGDQWLVQAGLEPGDQLVVDGQQNAAPGLEVNVTPWVTKPTDDASHVAPPAPAIKATASN
ncbi:efflux RND transporter periplasmic adaptor subunit [Pseudomonas marginalis]|uniref:efflux RND transporter periplasmic adaptor subunit n=1 Tax=Pseudomonas marginalis TaxID=298 RepID=UPI00386F7E67